MAVKLLYPFAGFETDTIVRDLPPAVERTLAAAGRVTWHVDGGIEADRPTIPEGMSEEDARAILTPGRRVPAGQPFVVQGPVFRVTVYAPSAASITLTGTGYPYVPEAVTDTQGNPNPVAGKAVPEVQYYGIPAGTWQHYVFNNQATYYTLSSTAADTLFEVLP